MKQWNEHCSSNSNRSGNTTRAVIAVAIIVILLIIVKGKRFGRSSSDGSTIGDMNNSRCISSI